MYHDNDIVTGFVIMSERIGTFTRGILTFTWFLLSTVILLLPLLLAALFKLLIPVSFWQKLCTSFANRISEIWILFINFGTAKITGMEIDLTGDDDFKPRQWYLALSNHVSAMDPFVFARFLHGKVSSFKYFIKEELIWVPFLGIAFWALDFPILKRYPRSVLKKNPHLKGRDIERTRRSCDMFKYAPVTVFNFVEGTRYRPEKHRKQDSPYRHLLKPRSGGTALVLYTMGEYINTILDITVYYPGISNPTMWKYLSGQIKRVRVHVQQIPVTGALLGNYFRDPAFKEYFDRWLNNLWEEKDRLLDRLMAEEEGGARVY
jgi:1-acyl-sn-glycerol-3-phosphate acyltransferase